MEKLKQDFIQKMQTLLQEDFEDYIQEMTAEPVRGVRVNTLYSSLETFETDVDFSVHKSGICSEGYILQENHLRIGHHPYHHAGMFYVQEPSAMAPVEALDPRPGERVLDLCAAPGGKSGQIAARMKNSGVLVANEVVKSRAMILLSNLERLGVANACVTNVETARLCSRFPFWFDKILVDAPCSGEGMFRKNPFAIEQWSTDIVRFCAQRQLSILEDAANALAPGGTLVYSTCTFSMEENEEVIARFLSLHPEFSLQPVSFSLGRSGFERGPESFGGKRMWRFFPSRFTEGQFVARLVKAGQSRLPVSAFCEKGDYDLFLKFFEQTFEGKAPGNLLQRGENLFILPESMPEITDLSPLRCGVFAGKMKNNRFVPSHHLFKCFKNVKSSQLVKLTLKDPQTIQFLRGMEIDCGGKRGYCAVHLDDIPLGFGKASNKLKNHYPKGLREI